MILRALSLLLHTPPVRSPCRRRCRCRSRGSTIATTVAVLSCRRYIPNFSSIGRRYVDLGDAKNERSSTITDNIDTTKRRNFGRGNRLTLFLPCLFFLLVVFVSCLFDLFSPRAFALLLHCFSVSYHRTYTYTLRSPCCSFLSITH